MKTKTLNYKDLEIEFQRKNNIRNINLRIHPDGRISVSAPVRVPEREVMSFIRRQEPWIREHQNKLMAESAKPVRRWVSGEHIMVFGRKYTLMVTAEPKRKNRKIELQGEMAVLSVPPDGTTMDRDAFMRKWYHDVLEAEIQRMLPFWEQRTGLYSSGFRIRDMKSRWGSCKSRTGELCFNLQLVLYERIYLEYVILHELAHIEEPNHSPAFWAIVEEYLPEWKVRRKEMRSLKPDYLPAEE